MEKSKYYYSKKVGCFYVRDTETGKLYGFLGTKPFEDYKFHTHNLDCYASSTEEEALGLAPDLAPITRQDLAIVLENK